MMNNCKFLITGATGFIGSTLVRYIIQHFQDVHIFLPVRNKAKAESMYGSTSPLITIYECDLLTTDFEFVGDVDYIIHCAAPTDSRYFVEHPIETYNSIFLPSLHLLEYAAKHVVKGFVYLSSLEVYGTIEDGSKKISEGDLGHIDVNSTRSCYPLAKRAVEHLCYLYAHQYNISVSIARLTQTTGAGIPFDDNRAINTFCRSAVKNEDIVLHTAGETSRPYCHIDDAITAIMLLLNKGDKGETYNVANESTYISAYNLALYVKEKLNDKINVRIDLKKNTPFAPSSFLPLSTTKLKTLGWQPRYSLENICKDVFNHYKSVLGDE